MSARQGSGAGVLRLGLSVAVLLASLSLVIWRQSRALEQLRALDAVRRERAVAEAERAGLAKRLEVLESRNWVVAAARDRLGMRVPVGPEIVILRVAEPGGRGEP